MMTYWWYIDKFDRSIVERESGSDVIRENT